MGLYHSLQGWQIIGKPVTRFLVSQKSLLRMDLEFPHRDIYLHSDTSATYLLRNVTTFQY
jgi:hypothetical protein